MSDLQELLIGIGLIVTAIGFLMACVPRGGRAAWFVGKPFLESGMSLLLVITFIVGAVLLVSRFTTIDDMTTSGKVEAASGHR